MHLVQPRTIRLQASPSDLFAPTLQPVAVDQLVRQEHDVLIHAVLFVEVDDGLRVRLGEHPEERHIQSLRLRLFVPHQRGKLEMVPDKHELLGEPQWTETCRQRHLRGLVDDAVVEHAAGE